MARPLDDGEGGCPDDRCVGSHALPAPSCTCMTNDWCRGGRVARLTGRATALAPPPRRIASRGRAWEPIGSRSRAACPWVCHAAPHARVVTHKGRDGGIAARVARERTGDSYLLESGAASALEMMSMTSRELQARIFRALKAKKWPDQRISHPAENRRRRDETSDQGSDRGLYMAVVGPINANSYVGQNIDPLRLSSSGADYIKSR